MAIINETEMSWITLSLQDLIGSPEYLSKLYLICGGGLGMDIEVSG